MLLVHANTGNSVPVSLQQVYTTQQILVDVRSIKETGSILLFFFGDLRYIGIGRLRKKNLVYH